MKKKVKKIKRITPNSLTFPDNYSLEEQGLSQSLMSTFLKCRQAFLYKINRYAHPSKIGNTNFGSLIHDILATIYIIGKPPNAYSINNIIEVYRKDHEKEISFLKDKQFEVDAAKAFAVTKCYVEHYKDDIRDCKYDVIEKEFEVKFNGIILRGKIDTRYLTKNGDRWQMEHKTKGRISEKTLMRRLTFDPQNLLYLLAGELEYKDNVKGVLYNIIRNPQLKMRVGDTPKDYQDRIIEDITTRPKFYFMQFEIPYTPLDKERFEQDLINIIWDLQDCFKYNADEPFYKNGYACDTPFECEYLDACSSNSFAGYIKQDKIFPELNECRY